MSDLDFNELFKNNEFGFSLGLGMTFNLSENSHLNIEVRNDFGISDLGDTELGGISKSKSNTLRLIVNYSLNI